MEHSTGHLTLRFAADDREVAAVAERTFLDCSPLITALWGVPEPEDCRVHVMTSWRAFIVESAPWYVLPILGVTFPFWAARAARIWPLAGGWELSYGRRRVVGIKPPRLLQGASSSIGREIFEPERSIDEKFRATLCHELTHAFTSHLRLPVWLKEGLAMVTVDRYLGRGTVRRETLAVLERSAGRLTPKGRVRLDVRERESLVYLYVFGYWLTLCLLEIAPDALRSLLDRKRPHGEIESRIADLMGMDVDAYRRQVDLHLSARFSR